MIRWEYMILDVAPKHSTDTDSEWRDREGAVVEMTSAGADGWEAILIENAPDACIRCWMKRRVRAVRS